MKKILTILCLAFVTGTACAWEWTTDKFVISDLTVAPGGDEVYFTVSLDGTRYYTAYNLDIHLPEGLEVAYTKSNKPHVTMTASKTRPSVVYPSASEYDEDLDMDIYTYPHTLDFTYSVVAERDLRLACSSNTNDAFVGMSGELFKVYVKASPFMKPGTAEITIDGQNLTLPNGDKFVPYEYEKDITISTTSKVSVNVSATNKWSTCVLPFSAAVPAGVTAYSCSSVSGDNLVLTPANELAAYTPYILFSETGYSATLSGEVNPSQYVEVVTSGLLSGAIMPQSVTSGYVLQNKGEGPMFYDIDGQSFTIPSGKCWLAEDAGLSRARYGFFDESTGIKDTIAFDRTKTCYNLQGQKIAKPRCGKIYIIEGRKILTDK